MPHSTSSPDLSCWLALGDIHDDSARLTDIPELADVSDPAGVIVTGDITFAGGLPEALNVLDPLAAASAALLAQPGNMDKPEIASLLEERGWNIHARARRLFPGVYVLGVGCSPPTPFNTPSEYPEERLAGWLEEARQEAFALAAADGVEHPVLVLVAHAPPHGTACDRLNSGASVGSTAVRAFIEKHQPALCLCGHIHESRAEDHIGATRIFNPGDFSSGGYVVVRRDKKVSGLVAELKQLP